MQPGPLIDPSVKVVPALIRTDGDTFHPLPRSRAAFLPVPSVAMPALPFSPVKFSELIDRLCGRESLGRSPRSVPSPLNPRPWANNPPARRPRIERDTVRCSQRLRDNAPPFRFILFPFPL